MINLLAYLVLTVPVGVTPNDLTDDGPGFRSALATACATDHLLEVPAGEFYIGQEPGKLGGLNIVNCHGLTMKSVGRHGAYLNQVGRYMGVSEDYYLINIENSTDIEITGLTLDGKKDDFYLAGAVAEQVHAIRTYNVSRVDLHDMNIVDSFGDCMKNINADDVTVVNVRCRGSERDGVNSHSNSEDVRIVATSFSDIVGQHVATEGAGGNKRWILVGNTFHRDTAGLVLDIGTGAEDVIVTANTFFNGGFQSYQTDDLAVVSNVWSMPNSTGAPLYLKGKTNRATIASNLLESYGTTGEGSCIRAWHLDAARDPSSLVIVGNNCLNYAPAPGIGIGSGQGKIVLDANLVESAHATLGSGISVSNLLSGTAAKDVNITDNLLVNEATGIGIGAGYGALDSMNISGNNIRSTKTNAKGVYTQWYNHVGTPAPLICRVDDNITNVPGLDIYNTPASPPWTVNPGEGCLPYGSVVP